MQTSLNFLKSLLVCAALLIPYTAFAADVSARFYGSSSFLFDDGETQILIDGFFSRQRYTLLYGSFSPDMNQIADTIRKTGICVSQAKLQADTCNSQGRLKAIVPVHGHYDHALDSGVLALWSGAKIVATQSVLNIINASKALPHEILSLEDWRKENPVIVGDRKQLVLDDTGKFKITLIQSDHLRIRGFQIAPGQTETNFEFPIPIRKLKADKNFNVLIEHSGRRLLIVPSAGDLGNMSKEQLSHIDTLYLSIGGMDLNSSRAQKNYWDRTVGLVNPKTVSLIHWDSDKVKFDFKKPTFEVARKYFMQKLFEKIREEYGKNRIIRVPPALVQFDPFLQGGVRIDPEQLD